MINLTSEWKAKFRITWDFWEESSWTGITKEEWSRYSELSEMAGTCAFCDFFDCFQPITNGLCPLRSGEQPCCGRLANCCNGIYLGYTIAKINPERQLYSILIFDMVDKWCKEIGVNDDNE